MIAIQATMPAPQAVEPMPSTKPSITSSGNAPALHPNASKAAGPATTPHEARGIESYTASFFASAQPVTANDMIARLPGFTFDDGGGARGYASAGGNVLVDGRRPASKSDDLSSVLARIPAAQVERIDIIPGGAPGIDMQGKAVIANVIRRAGASSTHSTSLTQQIVTSDGRYIPTGRIEGTHTNAKDRSWGWSLNGGREFDDSIGNGYRSVSSSDGRPIGRASDDVAGIGYFANLAANYAQPLWGGRLRVYASGQYETFMTRETVGSIPSVPAASDERDRQHTKTGELGLNYVRPINSRLSSETVLIQQITGEDYRADIATASRPPDGQLFDERHTQTESIARETLTWVHSPSLTIEGGAEGDYNRLVSHSALADNGVAQDLPAANVVVDEKRGEVFARATIAPARHLNLEIGARTELSQIRSRGDVVLSKTLSYFKPRALLTWTVVGEDQIRVRLEREVAQLNFADFIATSSFSTGQVRAGNPDLVPQQAKVAEVAYEKHFLKTGAAVVTYRHSWLEDVLDRAPVFGTDGAFDAPANIGRGTRDEVVGTLTLPLGVLGLANGLLKGDLAWQRTSVVDPTTGDRRPISGLYPFKGSLTLNQDLPRQHLSLSATLNSGYDRPFFYFNQIQHDRIQPYGSVQATYRPTKRMTLTLLAYDLGRTNDRLIERWLLTRANSSLASEQRRSLKIGPIVSFRVRRDR